MKTSLEMPVAVLEKAGHPEGMSLRRFAQVAGVLVVLALVLPLNAFGQGITGSITGTVVDTSGASVPGATVTVTQIATNSVHTVTTSDVGNYTVTQLPPGQYAVKVDKASFQSYEQKGINLSIDQVVQVNAQLAIGSTNQTIEVTSAGNVIQTEDSSVGSVIDSQAIQNT